MSLFFRFCLWVTKKFLLHICFTPKHFINFTSEDSLILNSVFEFLDKHDFSADTID